MSDTSSDVGSAHSTPSSSVSSNTRLTGKTKFERDIEAAQRKGVSECKNLMHWEVRHITNPTGGRPWTDAGIKCERDILKLMSPGDAKCSCEKLACRWAWTGNWNYKGMLQTQFVPVGLERKGVGEIRTGFPARKVFPLNFSLTKAEFDCLNARFPEWYFIGSHAGSHDHPVAHTSTKLSSERLLDGLRRGTAEEPKVYIDLNGNPMANQAYMRRNPGIHIITFVECITPKDYVRKALKWGPKHDAAGNVLWYDEWHIRDIPSKIPEWGHAIDGFISIHTMYYYDAREIVNLLAWAPNAVFYGLMHRFEGAFGTLNLKEQEWTKTDRGAQKIVRQVNVKTGEAYEHPDNSWWFNHDSYATDDHGMGWTIGLLCEESYSFAIAYCPRTQALMSTRCVQMAPICMPAPAHSTAKAMTQGQIAEALRVDMSLYGARTSMPIKPQHVMFFGELRTTMIGKARTATAYRDHVSRAKVKASSVMTSQRISVDAQELMDMARYSFFIDYEDQYGADKVMFSQSYATTLMADNLYKKGNNLISTGTLSALCDILMAAADGKDLKMAAIKGARAGIQHLNRKSVLDTL